MNNENNNDNIVEQVHVSLDKPIDPNINYMYSDNISLSDERGM